METNEKNTNVKAKLHSALTNIQLELGALKKDGKVEFGGGYDYISYENLNSELKVLLHKHGISIIPDMESCEINRIEGVKNDKKVFTNTCLLKLNIIVTDTETGYSETFKTFAYAEDNGDKVVGKAFTEALKRWEFKTFHVTSKDSKLFDIDYYQQDNETHEKPTITRKEEKPEPKEDIKPKTEPKQNDDTEPRVNLRAALATLTVNKETDTNCILAALKSKGFKTAAEVPESQHQQIINISKELYKEFLKSEQYKKDKENGTK